MENKSFNKILIIRLSALGDTIHTLPLAYAIKQKYPNIQLDWVVEDKASKFIINNPLINKVYELPKKKWKASKDKIKNLKEFWKIIKEIKQEKYDIVIDTQQLLKSSVIMGLSGGKRKISLDNGREFSGIFANEIITTGKKQFDKNFHVIDRNLEIAKYLGCDELEHKIIIPDFSNEYSSNIKNIIKAIDKTKKTIILAPATTWDNKHWNNQGWADIINEFKEAYNIIITASGSEKTIVNDILSKVKDKTNIINLSGLTTIPDLIYLYKNSDLVISPDSGSAHVAMAAEHPSIITLFFSTSANRTAPKGEKYYSVSAAIQCQPCMKKKCRKTRNINACQNKIDSQEIINIVKKVLQ